MSTDTLEKTKRAKMAAKPSKTSNVRTHIAKPRRKRPGVHSKCKNSRTKTGKNYRKKYAGQGR